MESRTLVPLHLLGLLFVLLTATLHPGVSTASPGQPLHIAMLLWRGETEAEKGFKDGLQERGYTADYTVFDSQQDIRKLGLMLRDISTDIKNFDYVYTFGTTVSRRANLVIDGRVPQVFNAVTDPVGAGIAASLHMPGSHVGGASDAIPLALQLDGMLKVMEIRKLGFFFNPREKNSMLIRGELYQLALKHRFEVIDFRSPPAGKVLADNLQRVVEEPGLVDAVFFPSDSYLASQADYIGKKVKEARIASFGSLREYIENGLLMGFVVDYYQLGKGLAEVVERHRQERSFSTIPIIIPSGYQQLINLRTQKLLGLELPESVLEKSVLLE